jgi:hypothetical protein
MRGDLLDLTQQTEAFKVRHMQVVMQLRQEVLEQMVSLVVQGELQLVLLPEVLVLLEARDFQEVLLRLVDLLGSTQE